MKITDIHRHTRQSFAEISHDVCSSRIAKPASKILLNFSLMEKFQKRLRFPSRCVSPATRIQTQAIVSLYPPSTVILCPNHTILLAAIRSLLLLEKSYITNRDQNATILRDYSREVTEIIFKLEKPQSPYLLRQSCIVHLYVLHSPHLPGGAKFT